MLPAQVRQLRAGLVQPKDPDDLLVLDRFRFMSDLLERTQFYYVRVSGEQVKSIPSGPVIRSLHNNSSGDVAMVAGDGKVGIAAASPTEKLAVIGKIKTSGILQVAIARPRVRLQQT